MLRVLDSNGNEKTVSSVGALDFPTTTVTGTLATVNGGTGIDASGVTDGQVLIGKTSDHSLNLATLSAGAGVSITNGAGSVTIAQTPVVANNRVMYAFAQDTSGPAYSGVGCVTPTTTGTAPVVNDQTDSMYAVCTTAASLNATSGVQSTASFRLKTYSQTWIWYVKTDAAVTNKRHICKVSNTAGIPTSNTPNEAAFGFRYEGGTDSGWVGYCQTSNVAISVSSTVAAIAGSTVYKLKVVYSAGVLSFSVNDGAAQTLNTNLPSTTTTLSVVAMGVATTNSTAQTFRWKAFYYESV